MSNPPAPHYSALDATTPSAQSPRAPTVIRYVDPNGNPVSPPPSHLIQQQHLQQQYIHTNQTNNITSPQPVQHQHNKPQTNQKQTDTEPAKKRPGTTDLAAIRKVNSCRYYSLCSALIALILLFIGFFENSLAKGIDLDDPDYSLKCGFTSYQLTCDQNTYRYYTSECTDYSFKYTNLCDQQIERAVSDPFWCDTSASAGATLAFMIFSTLSLCIGVVFIQPVKEMEPKFCKSSTNCSFPAILFISSCILSALSCIIWFMGDQTCTEYSSYYNLPIGSTMILQIIVGMFMFGAAICARNSNLQYVDHEGNPKEIPQTQRDTEYVVSNRGNRMRVFCCGCIGWLWLLIGLCLDTLSRDPSSDGAIYDAYYDVTCGFTGIRYECESYYSDCYEYGYNYGENCDGDNGEYEWCATRTAGALSLVTMLIAFIQVTSAILYVQPWKRIEPRCCKTSNPVSTAFGASFVMSLASIILWTTVDEVCTDENGYNLGATHVFNILAMIFNSGALFIWHCLY